MISAASTSTSIEPAPVDDQGAQRAASPPAAAGTGPRSTCGEEAPELDEQHERQQHADEVSARVGEHRVAEARGAERRRDQREHDHGALLGQAVVDEPVRGVVAAALVDRPPLEQAHDRSTSAVSRIGTASMIIGSSSVATVVPASFQLADEASAASANPITWLPESPMNTAAGLRGRRLKGRKPTQASATASESISTSGVRVVRERVDREVRAGDRGERRRQAVHVVEQVERVRHARRARAARSRWRGRRWRRSPRACRWRSRARPRRPAPPSFASGGSGAASSASPTTKRIVQPPRIPSSAPSTSTAPAAPATRHAGEDPGEDADAAERRRDLLVPAVARGEATTRPASGERSSGEEHERATGERDQHRGPAHEARLVGRSPHARKVTKCC